VTLGVITTHPLAVFARPVAKQNAAVVSEEVRQVSSG
jgi:hypothetical protein